MKPHPRVRKMVKWGGLVAGMALVPGWLVLFLFVGAHFWHSKDGRWARLDVFDFSYGQVVPAPPEYDPAFVWGKTSKERWWSYDRPAPQLSISIAHLLLISTACLGLSGIAWWLDRRDRCRRARVDLCPECNYERTGLVAGAVCPECGAKGGV